ncbi:MAG TPA: DMT family transporter, partial [bacterium]|nr:DMT family transporter [bacterium]
VGEIGPLTLVAYRLLFGLIGLLGVLRLQRKRLPLGRAQLPAYLLMGLFQAMLPISLISWGETRIDSGLAAILNGTVPLFAIVISHYWLTDEKMTAMRVVGLIVGFAGVVVLVSDDFRPGALSGSLLGQLAVLAAAASYGMAATFSRRYLRNQPPVLQGTMVLLTGDAFAWLAVLGLERPIQTPALPITWVAILWLGLLGSCVAYLLFFYLINSWGPTRASVVTYVFPIIGLLLGIVFLNERPDWRLYAGTALIVAGIVVLNVLGGRGLRNQRIPGHARPA